MDESSEYENLRMKISSNLYIFDLLSIPSVLTISSWLAIIFYYIGKYIRIAIIYTFFYEQHEHSSKAQTEKETFSFSLFFCLLFFVALLFLIYNYLNSNSNHQFLITLLNLPMEYALPVLSLLVLFTIIIKSGFKTTFNRKGSKNAPKTKKSSNKISSFCDGLNREAIEAVRELILEKRKNKCSDQCKLQINQKQAEIEAYQMFLNNICNFGFCKECADGKQCIGNCMQLFGKMMEDSFIKFRKKEKNYQLFPQEKARIHPQVKSFKNFRFERRDKV
jgi:hypothetical protein